MRGLALLMLLLALACGDPPDEERAASERVAPQPLSVYVVNEPLRYIAERIGGERVRASFPAPAGIDPAHWTPDAETLAAYQRADLVLRNGAGYAAWPDRATLSRHAVVDTANGFADRWIRRPDEVSHQHGPDGAHSHSRVASTTWLDPRLAILQARAVGEAFSAARPDDAAHFAVWLAALESDLEALDARLASASQGLGPVVFSHPVYQYLERRYDLDGRSLHWEPDVAPDPAAWRALESLLEEHPARLILWEAEPLPETRQRLEELGLVSVVFAPGGGPGEDAEDWLAGMHANAARLETVR